MKTISPVIRKFLTAVLVENHIKLPVEVKINNRFFILESELSSREEASQTLVFESHGKTLDEFILQSFEPLSQRETKLLLAPYLILLEHPKAYEIFSYYHRVWDWLLEAKKISPQLCDWIGIYFYGPKILPEQIISPLLLVGPYIGEVTEHISIPVSQGLCGLAFRERRVVNMADVHSDPRHIACSLKTRSELIIPLYDKHGEMIAELDIDSHTPNAFSPDIEEQMIRYCQTFPKFQESDK